MADQEACCLSAEARMREQYPLRRAKQSLACKPCAVASSPPPTPAQLEAQQQLEQQDNEQFALYSSASGSEEEAVILDSRRACRGGKHGVLCMHTAQCNSWDGRGSNPLGPC